MKTIRISVILFLMLLCLGVKAQTDSRNRTKETIVQDGLAQLPAKNLKVFEQITSEIAGTGKEGMEMLVGMMQPAAKAKNATFEYAIDGVVSYVSEKKNASLKENVLKGLMAGFDKCTDDVNRAFLITEMARIATAENASFFAKMLSDEKLVNVAVSALASIKGTDNVIADLIKKSSTPKSNLAYLAYVKKLQGVEDGLLSWIKDADETTLASIYNALTVCGGEKSVNLLKVAAQSKKFANDATGATDAYLQLLNNIKSDDIVIASAKTLLKSDKEPIRCAGLRLLLQRDKTNAIKNVMSALKDASPQYRNTALNLAQEVAGKGIFDKITAKKFSNGATADIIRWIGNNKRTEQIGYVVKAIRQHSDSTITRAAIEAAGKIGTDDALAILIQELSGNYAAEAKKALTSYNGKINSGIAQALTNQDKNICKNALELASTRHIYNTYNTILNLTKSDDSAIRDLAYKSLAGVSTTGNFEELCKLMEDKKDGKTVGYLQKAAQKAIQSLSAEEQYNLVEKHITQTSSPSLYYPLLAQVSSAKAINKLKSEYEANRDNRDAAYKALLQVDNPDVAEVLYNICRKDGSKVNEALERYLSLVRKSDSNPTQKYLLYKQALELNPTNDAVKRKALDYLAECHQLPALVLVSKYMDNDATAMKAATTVKTIASKTPSIQGGLLVKDVLTKALEVFKAQTNNADAGYAVDEINGQILPKFSPNGYVKIEPQINTERILLGTKKYENFELYMEWKSTDNAMLKLRSMPQLLYAKDKISVNASNVVESINPGDWNMLFIKVVNDRLHVESNGRTVVDNFIMKNSPETLPLNNEGIIEIQKLNSDFSIRDVYIKELPSTPIYRLTADEEKAGYEVLFDGRNLDKWQGNLTDYVPLDGNIYVSAKYGGTGNLYTKKRYSDFIYRFEFCFDEPGVNNGIGIRTNIGTDAAYDGMEIQVLDHDDPIYKGLHDYQRHGSVYGIIVPKHIIFDKVGTWYSEEIRAIGDHITVIVNGDVVLDGNIREACQGHNVAPDGGKVNPYTVDHKNHPGLFNKDGYISFCGHGVGVKFRNVRILDLSKSKKKKR